MHTERIISAFFYRTREKQRPEKIKLPTVTLPLMIRNIFNSIQKCLCVCLWRLLNVLCVIFLVRICFLLRFSFFNFSSSSKQTIDALQTRKQFNTSEWSVAYELALRRRGTHTKLWRVDTHTESLFGSMDTRMKFWKRFP